MAETLDEIVERVARAVTVAQNCQSKVPGNADYCANLHGCGRTGKCNTPHASADVERVRTALTALARTHALVPREATQAMLDNAATGWDSEGYGITKGDANDVYRATLSASDLLASLREGG